MTTELSTSSAGALHYGIQEIDGHCILAVDPPGKPRIVEALGEVVTADHIAIIVPGNSHHQENYFADGGPVGPRASVEFVLATMQAIGPVERAAVVVWLVYHTPFGMAAVFSNRRAREGACDLAR